MTIWSRRAPAAASTASTLSSALSTSRAKSPMKTLFSLSVATWPETKTKSPALVADDSGTVGAGSPSGWNLSIIGTWNHIPCELPMPDELLLTGGLVVDGSGGPAVTADVLVRAGRIAAIGDGLSAERVRDVSGRVVCPGFVDMHTHSDLTLLSDPRALSKVHQGVTTEVVGNCGLGVAPLAPGAPVGPIRQAVGYLDLDPAVDWSWPDLAGYLAALVAARPGVNVATLVGHLALHASVVGFTDRPASAAEVDRMCGLLGEAFDAGAVGLSTGLVYAPLPYVRDDELLALASVVADRDRIFTWHVRNYDDDLLESVAQAVRVARATGARTQISHLAAVGRRNWGAVRRALDLVDAANADGCDIGVDIYPYLHGNAPLSQLLPGAHPGGRPGGLGAAAARSGRARRRSAPLG